MSFRFSSVALSLSAVIACGSKDQLFGGGGSSDGGSAGAPDTSSSSSTDASTTQASTGGGGSTSSSGGSGGATTSQSTTTGPGGGSSIDCGQTSCSFGGDSACCWDLYQQYGMPYAECVMGSVENDGCSTTMPGEPGEPGIETRIECQTTSQCGGGQVCCGHREQFFSGGQQYTYYESLTCQASCQWPDITMCDDLQWSGNCPMVDGPNGPVQGECKQSDLLPPGYIVCGTPAP
jgi:hypothetical protein